jgi:hypothetical protein
MQTRKIVGVGVAVVAVALAVASWRSTPAPTPAAPPQWGTAVAPPPPPTPGETPADFRPLLGEWERPDGGYVLVVRGVRADGGAQVAYLNPRPIRVARAEARREGDLIGLFVQLDDVNYEGSTYTLGFDARADQLRGLYYQAPTGQQFEVVFVRRR